ncbi:MAG TPA: toll/interleukin-1 receptor domain-containing protein [Ktedonobacterales bacterium]|jgi:hypothetical protein
MNIYLSSAGEDLAYAQQLAGMLPGLLADADVGDVTVYAPQDDAEREARLAESRFVVFLVSAAALQSAGVARDIEQVRGMENPYAKHCITVTLQPVALDGYLAGLRSVDAISRPIAEVAAEVAYYATWELKYTGARIYYGPPRPKPAAPPPPPEAERSVPPPAQDATLDDVRPLPPAPPPMAEAPGAPPWLDQELPPDVGSAPPPYAPPPATGGAPPPAPAAPSPPPPPRDEPYGQPAPAPWSPAPAPPPPATGADRRARGTADVTSPTTARTLQFSAYHPNVVAVETWHTLLVYTYVAEALAAIQADAGTFTELGSAPTVAKGQSARTVERGVELTVEPHMEGVTFSPATDTFVWREDWRRSLFRFSGAATLAGHEQRGWIDIYAGPMVPIARIDITFPFRESGAGEHHLAVSAPRGMIVSSNIYDAVFISYSHRDREAFRQACEEYHRFGITVYTDEKLESGVNYEVELARMIAEANIFHLLWSRSSAASPECRKEWRSALQREPTERFIKPWFWKQPLAPLPDEFTQHRISFKYEPLKRHLLRPETWF